MQKFFKVMFTDNCVNSSRLMAPGATTAPNFDISILNLTETGGPRLPVLYINSRIILQNLVPPGTSSTSFNQLWMAYRNGFGDLTLASNYWIGNEVIYGLVITGNYQLRVEVTP